MSAMPTVSVVIPCYNGAKYLRETLESALAQTHKPLEILVIDDGSTDDSATIAESFGNPVRVIRQSNQGESVARNRGIDEAKGDWVAFLDADDLWLPDKLDAQLQYVAQAEGCVQAVGTRLSYLDQRDGSKSQHSAWDFIPDARSFTFEAILTNGSPVHVSSLLVDTKVKSRFPEWTRYGEDTLYFLGLLLETELHCVDKSLTVYRLHQTAQTRALDICCKWHESHVNWLQMHSHILDTGQIKLYCSMLDAGLLGHANKAVYLRQWDKVRVIRDYARRRGLTNAYSEWHRIPKYPVLIYSVVDFARSLLRRISL